MKGTVLMRVPALLLAVALLLTACTDSPPNRFEQSATESLPTELTQFFTDTWRLLPRVELRAETLAGTPIQTPYLVAQVVAEPDVAFESIGVHVHEINVPGTAPLSEADLARITEAQQATLRGEGNGVTRPIDQHDGTLEVAVPLGFIGDGVSNLSRQTVIVWGVRVVTRTADGEPMTEAIGSYFALDGATLYRLDTVIE
jgi:hypothetical protein